MLPIYIQRIWVCNKKNMNFWNVGLPVINGVVQKATFDWLFPYQPIR